MSTLAICVVVLILLWIVISSLKGDSTGVAGSKTQQEQRTYEWENPGMFTETQKRLAELAVEAGLSIPLAEWKETPGKSSSYYAVTNKGSTITVQWNSGRRVLLVDDEEAGAYWDSYGIHSEESNICGYSGISSLLHEIESEMRRRKQESERPSLEAAEAVERQKREQQRALDEKRARDIMNRL